MKYMNNNLKQDTLNTLRQQIICEMNTIENYMEGIAPNYEELIARGEHVDMAMENRSLVNIREDKIMENVAPLIDYYKMIEIGIR